MNEQRWTISQIGAREHYAAARAMHRRGCLRTLYTEAWCRWGGALLSRGTRAMRAFAGRSHPELPDDRVVSFTAATMLDALHRRQRGPTWHTHAIEVGRRYCERVNAHLSRTGIDAHRDVFFGFNTGCLETLQLLRDRGVPCLVDQIDPCRTEHEMVAEEAQRWPGWEARPDPVPDAYYQRLADEWRLATRVIVNSPWSRDALMQQGVPRDKLAIVPLAYEPPAAPPRRQVHDRPLTVLWLGAVILRKGIAYLIQAAQELRHTPIRFVVAGQVLITDKAIAQAPPNVQFTGVVTRDRVAEMYRDADVFVLPTISDGFAITQLEAMAQGLPVITTPNCGQVVTHGSDGLIVPIRDARKLAEAIASLDDDRRRLAEMSRQAVEKSQQFSIDRYGERLVAALNPSAAEPIPSPQA